MFEYVQTTPESKAHRGRLIRRRLLFSNNPILSTYKPSGMLTNYIQFRYSWIPTLNLMEW